MPNEYVRQSATELLGEFETLYKEYAERTRQRISGSKRADDLGIVYEELRIVVGFLKLIYNPEPEQR